MNKLKRAKERGVTLQLFKSTVCVAQAKWFGRAYSAAGVSADLNRIEHIKKADPPGSIEKVRLLLQARNSFDHRENDS